MNPYYLSDLLNHAFIQNEVQQQARTNLLRSASCGSVPGKLTVIVVGALTSYFRRGLRHTCILTRKLNNVFDRTATTGCKASGKKLKYRNFQSLSNSVYTNILARHLNKIKQIPLNFKSLFEIF